MWKHANLLILLLLSVFFLIFVVVYYCCCCWECHATNQKNKKVFSPHFLSCVSDWQTTTVGFPNRNLTNGYMPISNSIGLLFRVRVCVRICTSHSFCGPPSFFLQFDGACLFVCLFLPSRSSLFFKKKTSNVSDCLKRVGTIIN